MTSIQVCCFYCQSQMEAADKGRCKDCNAHSNFVMTKGWDYERSEEGTKGNEGEDNDV